MLVQLAMSDKFIIDFHLITKLAIYIYFEFYNYNISYL